MPPGAPTELVSSAVLPGSSATEDAVPVPLRESCVVRPAFDLTTSVPASGPGLVGVKMTETVQSVVLSAELLVVQTGVPLTAKSGLPAKVKGDAVALSLIHI